MQNQGPYDYTFKLVLIGDPSVGKSNLLLRYCKNSFNTESTTTIGVEFGNKIININNKQIKAQIWDTCGQEQFKSIAKAYYKGAVGALIVYDITRKETFLNAERWYKDLKDNLSQDLVVMLVGNKCDLKHLRAVTAEEAAALAEKKNMVHMETSALESTNVDMAFNSVVREVFNLVKSESQVSSVMRQSNGIRLSSKPAISEPPTANEKNEKDEKSERSEKKSRCCSQG